jgi:hypothetical protein
MWIRWGRIAVSLILSFIIWLILVNRLYETMRAFGAIAVAALALAMFLSVAVFLALVLGILWKCLKFSFP